MGIKRVPTYFNEFVCIGGACEDNCCIGWEVDIDDESLEVYKSVSGAFGDRLRRYMNDENSFTLKNNRCPFLNDKNLSARTSSAPFVRNIRDLPKYTAV